MMFEFMLSTQNTTNVFAIKSLLNSFKFSTNKSFKKIVNPDDECVLCNCETAYHDNCIIDDSTVCLYCGKQLKDEIYYSLFSFYSLNLFIKISFFS